MKKSKIKIITSILAVFLILFLGVFFVQAKDTSLSDEIVSQIAGVNQTAGFGEVVTPQSMIMRVIVMALSLVGTIFFALIVWGGFTYLNSGGDDEKAKKGMDMIKAAIIGLAIVLFSYAITNFVGTRTKQIVTSGQKVDR